MTPSPNPLADRVVNHAHALVATTERTTALPLLATNLAVMLSQQRGNDPIVAVIGQDDSIGARAFRLCGRIYGRVQDDWYHRGRSHVGASVIPALLSVDVDDVVAPFIAGYGAMMAVSAAYGAQAHGNGLRPTSMFGPAGASVAAAMAMGLDRPAIAQALSMALVGSGGHSACMIEGTDEWRYEIMLAIRAGTEAAWLASHGAIAAKRTFEGKAGWCNAFFGDPDGAALTAILAAPPEPINAVSVKPFPASGVAMASMVTASRAGAATGRAMPTSFKLFCSPAVIAVPGSLGRAPYMTRIASGMSLARCAAEAYLTGSFAASAPAQHVAAIAALDSLVEVQADPSLSDDTARVEVE
ncbi:MAG TPA: MmgE/PrpD family protein, partial [Devosia sp.]|nr:MmgE/PrpD family protein [Devosia sp.]